MSRLSEFALIAELFAPLAKSQGAFGLTDDAALFSPRPGHDLIVTADALVEGVHFRKDDPPQTIARKALRVNLSDLAAKGAEPTGYLLVLSLPAHIENDWLRDFAHGLELDQKTYGCSLMGGDTTSTPGPLTLAITALGYVPDGKMILRAGAKPGDSVYVSGTIGDAGAGLAVLEGEGAHLSEAVREHLIQRYRLPTPRLILGKQLRGAASAALDVSDGLIGDLAHIAEVSHVGIEIEADHIPRSAALRALWGEDAVRAATAGDDYEIAFTARPEEQIDKIAARAGVSVSRIGRVTKGTGVVLLDAARREIAVPRPGFTHF
jgi:thiamine-monophosphate kinase